MTAGHAFAMLIGVLGTSTIHLSKGVMKHGLVRLRDHTRRSSRTARTIYALGVVMNFTNPLWVIVANRFAPTVYYTSMYGIGLIALLLYSHRRLAETVSRNQVIGIGVIVIGTLLIGALELGGGAPSLYNASRALVLTIAVVWLIAAPLAALASLRASIVTREVIFGVAAGGLAALEAVVKGVSQAGAESSTFLPQTPANWALFVVSFAGAAGAFGMIQWAFLRSCRASMMGAIYTTTYVALPLIVSPLVTGSRVPSVGSLFGIAIIAGGALLAVSATRVTSATPVASSG
ncbi:MAG: hypothetical protein EA382_10835 [Spirochaetaceae bacterium]|nr:MAG: hypothetical protein EA382_10835 [Spirochaetaceae bacterium]